MASAGARRCQGRSVGGRFNRNDAIVFCHIYIGDGGVSWDHMDILKSESFIMLSSIEAYHFKVKY